MMFSITVNIFSHSSTAVTHPLTQSKSTTRILGPMRFACTRATWEMCLICKKAFFDVHFPWPGQVMSQLLSSEWPVRSSVLYFLALGYSQKIDPEEWQEKPLLIWYDAGREQTWG